jgi:hypothetical protein
MKDRVIMFTILGVLCYLFYNVYNNARIYSTIVVGVV